ncbi:uncharacterized protein LOC123296051 [Chrysoperla carnea]|uniref:uncharacterized protein LOC123296051 n=1 Tax=Chrysoperla carnea TaxID=189513 RepID=UPI001D0994C1|nr:uncharacterized protein LOC123296051 [Chrysoperla carnea]
MNKRKLENNSHLEVLQKKLKKYQHLIDQEMSSNLVDDSVDNSSSEDSDVDDQDQSSKSDIEMENASDKNLKASVELQETKGSEVPTLSESVLQILGSEKRLLKDKCFVLHPELASCWKDLLASGMNKEDKSKMIETYPNKGNCPLIAPTLNPELLPLLHKTAKSRDKFFANHQDVCGRSLVAIGTAICNILNDEEEPVDKEQLLKLLCDSSSMMCDLFFQLSKSRRAQLYSCVDGKRKSVLEDSPTDEFLFGIDLAKRIKNALAVEKTSLSLKNQTPRRDSNRPKNSLNWRSPSASRISSSQTGYRRHFNKSSAANNHNQITTRSRLGNQLPPAQNAQTQKK